MARPKLYIAPGSSSMAPHLALREAGADFELVPLSFHAAEQKEPDYKAINAAAKVPTYIEGELVLTEVLAILWHIARRHPQAKLLPEGLTAEAEVLSWMSYIAAEIHPRSRMGADVARPPWLIAEQRLASREWAVNDAFSIADIHLFRLFWRNHDRAGLDRASFPGLWAHYERMMERPAVIETCAAEAAIGYELPA